SCPFTPYLSLPHRHLHSFPTRRSSDLPLSVVSRLPAESSTRMTGCCANVTPAVALEDGCVWIVSLLAAPAFTIIVGLVLAVLVPSVMSVAVTVWEPAVLSVTLTVRVAADKAQLAGE